MEYFTVGEIGNQGFYPIPEKLFNNQHYQKKVKKIKKVKQQNNMVSKEVVTTEELLSDTSKLMYGIMCRYLNLSLQNGWFDEEKRIFIRLSLTTLGQIMNKSRDTIVKCKKQLENTGLLKIVKTQYQADVFYLGKVKDLPEDDILKNIENRIKKSLEVESIDHPKTLEVEDIDQSILPAEVVEDVDSKLVDSFDSNRVVPNRVLNKKTTTSNSFQIENILKELNYKASPGTIVNLERLNPKPERLKEVIEYVIENSKGAGFIIDALKHQYELPRKKINHITPVKAREGVKRYANHVLARYENHLCKDPIEEFNSSITQYLEYPAIIDEYRQKIITYIG